MNSIANKIFKVVLASMVASVLNSLIAKFAKDVYQPSDFDLGTTGDFSNGGNQITC